MNTPWGAIWKALRDITVSTADAASMPELERLLGLPFPGWPTTQELWDAAVRKFAYSKRHTLAALVELLADALAQYAVAVQVTPKTIGGQPALTYQSGTASEDRLLKTPAGFLITGGAVPGDPASVYVDTTSRWLSNSADVWAALDQYVLTDLTELPFVLYEPQPSSEDAPPIVAGSARPPLKGRAATVEVWAAGELATYAPPVTWLYQAAEAHVGGVDGQAIYSEPSADQARVGIYLYGHEDDVFEHFGDLLQAAGLAAGVSLRGRWRLA